MPVITPSNLTKLLNLIDLAYQRLDSSYGDASTPGSHLYKIKQAKCFIRGGSDVELGAIPATALGGYDLPVLSRQSPAFNVYVPTYIFKYNGLNLFVDSTIINLSAINNGSTNFVRGLDLFLGLFNNTATHLALNFLVRARDIYSVFSTKSQEFYLKPGELNLVSGYVQEMASGAYLAPVESLHNSAGFLPLFRVHAFSTNVPSAMPTSSFYDNSYGSPAAEDAPVRALFPPIDDLENYTASYSFSDYFKPAFDALRSHIQSKASMSFNLYLKEYTSCSFSEKMRTLYTKIYREDLPIRHYAYQSPADHRLVSKTFGHIELKIISGSPTHGLLNSALIRAKSRILGVTQYNNSPYFEFLPNTQYTLALLESVASWPDSGYAVFYNTSDFNDLVATYTKLNNDKTIVITPLIQGETSFSIFGLNIYCVERTGVNVPTSVGVGSVIRLSSNPNYIGYFCSDFRPNESEKTLYSTPTVLVNASYVIRSG